MSEESTWVLSKKVPAIPNAELFQSNFPLQFNIESDLTNNDINLLQHEVPSCDMKEWSSTLTLTRVTDCSEDNPVALIVVNPLKVFDDVILEHGLQENVDCRSRTVDTISSSNLEKVSQNGFKLGDSQDVETVKNQIEQAFNRCAQTCWGCNCKCKVVRKRVRLKAVNSKEPVEFNDKEENFLRKVLFKHSVDCTFSECKVPLCQEMRHHLKEEFLVNPNEEPVFPADDQYHVKFSALKTFVVNSTVQMNSDLVCVHQILINKGHFGAVYGCWLLGNKDRGEARMAVKKVTDKKSINATNNSMSLLSKLGESTNIAIPLLVLQSPRVCYQVMVLGDMDLKFLVKNGPLSDNLIAHLLHGVLTGVWYLHRRNYVHCDLKLANILVKDYNAVICDIDFVKEEDAKCVAGTPEFAAPEVWDGMARKPLDIHCIGIVLGSLTGSDTSLSFDKNDSKEVKQAKVMKRNKKVYQVLNRKCNKFAEVFRECTKENPSDRPFIKDLCANPLFKVKIETVSHEIDQILLKREATENDPKDDLPKKIVKKFVNQALEKLPKCFSDGAR